MAKHFVTRTGDGAAAAAVPTQERPCDFETAAWEFLRRNPAYQDDVARVIAGQAHLPDHWGLTVAVDPKAAHPPAGAWRTAPPGPTKTSLPHAERALEGSRRASARCSGRVFRSVPQGCRTDA